MLLAHIAKMNLSQSSVTWLKEAQMEPKPCNGSDRVRKYIFVVTCIISTFSEDADYSQVTAHIQRLSRFLFGIGRIYSQFIMLRWLLYSAISVLAAIFWFSAFQGFIAHLFKRNALVCGDVFCGEGGSVKRRSTRCARVSFFTLLHAGPFVEEKMRLTVELCVSLYLSVWFLLSPWFFKQNCGLLLEEDQGYPKPQAL